MLGNQSSNERLYLRREDGGRGIKSLKGIYKETRLRVACYIACSKKNTKDQNSIVEGAMKTMKDIGVEIQFEEGNIWIDEELIDGAWKPVWKRLKEKLKK